LLGLIGLNDGVVHLSEADDYSKALLEKVDNEQSVQIPIVRESGRSNLID